MDSLEPLSHFVDDYLAYLHEVHPTGATLDGVHTYDDHVEDFSRHAIDQHTRALSGFARRLQDINVGDLTAVEKAEQPMISANIQARMFELEQIRTWERNPHHYADTLCSSLAAQVVFTHAPLPERARRVLSSASLLALATVGVSLFVTAFDAPMLLGGAALAVSALGVLALSHGLTKLLVFTPSGTVGFFASLGLPAVLAWYAMVVETVGGLALVTGFYARVAAALQLPILLGATLVHLPNGWMFASQGGGFEFPLFWAVALMALALIGPGALAVRDVALPGTLTPASRPA